MARRTSHPKKSRRAKQPRKAPPNPPRAAKSPEDGASPPGEKRPRRRGLDHLPPALAAGLLLLACLLPVRGHWPGWLAAVGQPGLLGHSNGTEVLPAILLLVPASALALLASTLAPKGNWRSAGRHLGAGLSGLGLALAAWYAGDLGLDPFLSLNATIWGLPTVLLLPLAAGSLWQESDHGRRGPATFVTTLLLLASLVPTYRLAKGMIPLAAAFTRQREPALQVLQGVSQLLALIVALAGLWHAHRGLPRTLRRTMALGALLAPMIWAAAWVTVQRQTALVVLLPAGWSLALAWWAAGPLPDLGGIRRPWPQAAFWAVACLLLAAFLLLETQAAGYTATDENIYFYQALLVAQGKLPYRDFFFAHPPLHILLPALLFKLFGFHILRAKAISMGAAAGAALFVLLAARRLAGDLAALMALLLYAFGFSVLRAATNLTGMNMTVFFLTAGFLAFVAARPMTAGMLFGLSLSTGFYSVAAVAAVAVLALLRSPAFGLRLLAGTLAVWGSTNLFFLAVAPGAFLDGVYRYHGRKVPQDPRHMSYFEGPVHLVKALFYNLYVLLTGKPFKKTLYYHAHILWPALLAPGLWIAIRARRIRPGPEALAEPAARWQFVDAWVARRSWPRWLRNGLARLRHWLWEGPERGLLLAWLTGLALVAEFSMFRRLYSFYFVLWFPFASISAAWLLDRLARALVRPEHGGALLAAGAFAFAASLHPTCSARAQKVYPGELAHRGERLTYEWRDPMALQWTSPIVRALFWQDHRIRAEWVPPFRQFLWNKKRHFETAPAIARYIREHTQPHETIAGASAVAPLLAILSGRHIAAEFVDTNTNRFRAGLVTERGFYERICRTPLAYLVSAPASFFSWGKMRHHRKFLERFRLERTFVDRRLLYRRPFVVRLLRNVSGSTAPPYCRYLGR